MRSCWQTKCFYAKQGSCDLVVEVLSYGRVKTDQKQAKAKYVWSLKSINIVVYIAQQINQNFGKYTINYVI